MSEEQKFKLVMPEPREAKSPPKAKGTVKSYDFSEFFNKIKEETKDEQST